MKKFKFNLDPLLEMRDWEEQKARQGLAEANARVNDACQRIDSCKSELESTYASWQTAGQVKFTAVERLAMQSQITEVESRILQAETSLQEAEQGRVKAMEALKVASRNKKVVENLKEKRLQEYRAELLKKESMEIEDIFNARRSA